MFDWFFEAFYGLAGGMCAIVGWLYDFFEVFSGLKNVYYDGAEMSLLDFFMGNTAVSNLYWGMALVGIAMSFGFAIVSVTRKMFDGAGKHQHSMGNILSNLFKSILIILSLSIIMSMVLNSTSALMKAVSDQFSMARG
ncbi:MAG: hypothetical protein RR295_07210, partial [Oscillospiraceae bacterium]